jgi:hypothetical protein
VLLRSTHCSCSVLLILIITLSVLVHTLLLLLQQGLFQSDVFKTIGWVPSINVFWPSTDHSFSPPTIKLKTICNNSAGYQLGSSFVQGTAKCAHSLMNELNSLGNACHSKKAGCWMSPLYETFLIARAQAIIALFSTIPGKPLTADYAINCFVLAA